jgi:unsaturated rhamnogalacturonyl hydrolase
MMRKKFLFAAIQVVAALNLVSASIMAGNKIDSTKYYVKKVADWQWQELETKGWRKPQNDWTNTVMYIGVLAWEKATGDHDYDQKLIAVGNHENWRIGSRRFFADEYCIGQLYAPLYKKYKNPLYIADFKKMADSLVLQPHDEALEFKNGVQFREWAWCDALFMGPAALGGLSDATGDRKYLDEASKLWWKTSAYLYDKDEHLYFRDSQYFTKREPNGQKVFWSRGNGWVIAGMTNLLAVMPEDYKDRPRFLEQFKEMAKKLASIQQPDGSWHASLLDPGSYPNKETSGTGLICYALAWGVNHKILSYQDYAPVINRAWKALTTSVHSNGKLGFVQQIGEAPDKVGFDDTEVYGAGGFLLTGSEMIKLSRSKP